MTVKTKKAKKPALLNKSREGLYLILIHNPEGLLTNIQELQQYAASLSKKQ